MPPRYEINTYFKAQITLQQQHFPKYVLLRVKLPPTMLKIINVLRYKAIQQARERWLKPPHT